MSRPTKPLFLTTKGQRAQQADGLDLSDLVHHYRQIAGGLYTWDGLPDGVPVGFIEDTALFYSPGVGIKRATGYGLVVSPCQPSTLDVYGRPYEWIPTPLRGFAPMDDPFFTPSREPCLWMGVSVYDLIRPYIEVMTNAMLTLNQNLDALAQPVIVQGVPGAELGSMVMTDQILSKRRVIPATSAGLPIQVLDLKAQDHTANLVSVIDWCDSRILEVMASSNGVEKSSGINTMETVSGVQSVLQQLDAGLAKRQEWADAVNDRFRLDVSVSLGEGVSALTGGNATDVPEQGGEDNEPDA